MSEYVWQILIILNFAPFLGFSIPHPLPEMTIGSLPCSERYAMEPFFRQCDNVVGLTMQEYIKRKIPFGSDSTVARLLVLERQLIGEGSHRRLSSSIKFSIQPESSTDFSTQMCEVIVIERLPSGVFADPFELDHIRQRGVFKDASVFGDTNLELPSFLSNQSIVEIHLDVAVKISAQHEIINEFVVEIPLHARYPPLNPGGYATVRFDVPDLFLRCKTREDELAPTCLLTPITGLKVNDVKWSIPAGIEAHASTVSVITFTTALLSVLLITIATFKYTRIQSDARLKQS